MSPKSGAQVNLVQNDPENHDGEVRFSRSWVRAFKWAQPKKMHWLEAQLHELRSSVEVNFVREVEEYASRTRFTSTKDRNELYSKQIDAVRRLLRYIVFDPTTTASGIRFRKITRNLKTNETNMIL